MGETRPPIPPILTGRFGETDAPFRPCSKSVAPEGGNNAPQCVARGGAFPFAKSPRMRRKAAARGIPAPLDRWGGGWYMLIQVPEEKGGIRGRNP